jgi:hypothetical protein
MYEWLSEEIATIKTRKFHVIDGPLPTHERLLIERSKDPFPPSYRTFILQFGNAKLYRIGSQYRIQVFAIPTIDETEHGDRRHCFGRTDETLTYFKGSLLLPDRESPVFEWDYEEGVELEAANSFLEWIKKKCADARQCYRKKEWREIENGPPPFSEDEMRIIAESGFQWRRCYRAKQQCLRRAATRNGLIRKMCRHSPKAIPNQKTGIGFGSLGRHDVYPRP